MNIDSVKLLFFSSTGTTRKIIEGAVHWLQTDTVKHFDLTLPNNISQTPIGIDNGLAVSGLLYIWSGSRAGEKGRV